MASLIELGKSVFSGRSRIGLSGVYKKEVVTIDLDLVDSWVGTHNVAISKHPIEKDPTKDNQLNIVDHVNAESPTIRISGILSFQVLKNITAKEKLQIILEWQSQGTVIEILGYGTGGVGGIVKKLFTALNSGIGGLYDSNIDDPSYVGIDSDIIKNIVIGNISVTRKAEIGNDIEIAFDVQRIHFAIPKSSQKGVSGQSGNASTNKPAQQSKPKPAENQKVSSQNKQLFGAKKP